MVIIKTAFFCGGLVNIMPRPPPKVNSKISNQIFVLNWILDKRGAVQIRKENTNLECVSRR